MGQNGLVPYFDMGAYTGHSNGSHWGGLMPPSPTIWDAAFMGWGPDVGNDSDLGPAKGSDVIHAWEGRVPVVGYDNGTKTNAYATADGVLAWLLVDTTGLTGDQTWPILLTDTAGGDTKLTLAVDRPGGLPGEFDQYDSGAAVVNGSITIPEPITLTLLGFGVLGVLLRRRR